MSHIWLHNPDCRNRPLALLLPKDCILMHTYSPLSCCQKAMFPCHHSSNGHILLGSWRAKAVLLWQAVLRVMCCVLLLLPKQLPHRGSWHMGCNLRHTQELSKQERTLRLTCQVDSARRRMVTARVLLMPGTALYRF